MEADDRSHLEVEYKYQLDDHVPIPLSGLPGVAVLPADEFVLTATYYDTAALALLDHGGTLRRRTGGTDAGWHLKLATAGRIPGANSTPTWMPVTTDHRRSCWRPPGSGSGTPP